MVIIPDLQLGSTNGNNLGIATEASGFSTSALAGDMVLRSLNRLILQSGGGGYGILIDAANNVTCTGQSSNGSNSNIYAGGLRLGGFDTGN